MFFHVFLTVALVRQVVHVVGDHIEPAGHPSFLYEQRSGVGGSSLYD